MYQELYNLSLVLSTNPYNLVYRKDTNEVAFKNYRNPQWDRSKYYTLNDLENKFEAGGHLESDKENQVRSNLVDGRIEMNTLKEIMGCEPNYPTQIIGSIKLEKCFLLPYYRLA